MKPVFRRLRLEPDLLGASWHSAHSARRLRCAPKSSDTSDLYKILP